MRIVTSSEPEIEPVTLALAKQHARVSIDDEDNLINMYITSARRYCEKYCNISLITQTKSIFYDYNELAFIDTILLPVSPIQSVESFSTYDNNNDLQLVDADNYYLAGRNMVIMDAFAWPSNLRNYDTYQMDVVVGFGDSADDVPMEIREAILRLIAHTYQNREAIYDSVNGTFNNNVPHSVTACLAAYRELAL